MQSKSASIVHVLADFNRRLERLFQNKKYSILDTQELY